MSKAKKPAGGGDTPGAGKGAAKAAAETSSGAKSPGGPARLAYTIAPRSCRRSRRSSAIPT